MGDGGGEEGEGNENSWQKVEGLHRESDILPHIFSITISLF